MKRTTRFSLPAILILSIALLAACGNSSSGNNATPSSPAASAKPTNTASADIPASPGASADDSVRTLTDAVGHEVKVPVHPRRVIAPFLEDPLTALGVKPVAQWGAAGVPQQYLQDKLAGVPVLDMNGGLSPEETLSYSPDLIIFVAPSYMANVDYEQFAKIAPTYVLSNDESDWRGNFEKLGKLLNEEEAAKQALEQYDRKMEEAKSKLGDIPADKTAVLMQGDGEKGFKLFGPNFYGGKTLYQTLGFQQPAVLKGDYEMYSTETLADLKDVDYIFVISGKGRGKPPVDNPLWKSLSAVQSGRVFEADSGHWFNDNIVANGVIVDDVLNDVHA